MRRATRSRPTAQPALGHRVPHLPEEVEALVLRVDLLALLQEQDVSQGRAEAGRVFAAGQPRVVMNPLSVALSV